MEKFRKVCLPCDLPQWFEVKELLGLLKGASTPEAWIHRLQKVYKVTHNSSGIEKDVGASGGAKSKTPSAYEGLLVYLNDYLPRESAHRHVTELLPFIVDRALEIESFRAECDFVVPDGDTTIVLTRACACSLLSCCLLCIIPEQYPALPLNQGGSEGSSFTFRDFYAGILEEKSSSEQCQKLQCIFQYFELMSRNIVEVSEEIVFIRQTLKNIPTLESWLNCQKPLCHLETVSSEVRKVRHGKGGYLILLGEKSYGSHVLQTGTEEMELCFIENPELLAVVLFFDVRVENEFIMARGVTRFTSYPPRPSPNYLSRTSQHPQQLGPTVATICCSTLPAACDKVNNGDQVLLRGGEHYRHKAVVKTAGQMLSAFQQFTMDRSRLEEEEEEEDDDGGGGGTGSNVAVPERDSGHHAMSTSSSVEDDGVHIQPREIFSCRQPRHHSIHSSSSSSSCSNNNNNSAPENAVSSSKNQSSARSANSKRAVPWRSKSSASSSGSVDWSCHTMSFELESSKPVSSPSSSSLSSAATASGGFTVGNGVGGDEATGFTRRRSSALHSISRHSSGLPYQSSEEGGVYSRRRSSAMSDVSQRSGFSSNSSSSGKRSSTDYSSEMEEYFESFQRSSIKTSVIEEETGWVEESGKSQMADQLQHHQQKPEPSRQLWRFARDQPPDVLRPLPLRPLPPGRFSSFDNPEMMVLDNFADNLINQVAQDSRGELATLARGTGKGGGQSRSSPGCELFPSVPKQKPKALRRGQSADLFRFKVQGDAKTSNHVPSPPMSTRNSSQELHCFIDRLASVVSRRLIESAMEEASVIRDGSAPVTYETTRSVEDFACDFVDDVFADAFHVVSSRYDDPPSDDAGVLDLKVGGAWVRTQPNRVRHKEGIFFLDEKMLKKYSRRESDRRHVCAGSICFDEEDDEEEEEEDEDLSGAAGDAGRDSRPKLLGRSLSSGFRDPVLSDFEDLLVNSNINSPGRIMFASESDEASFFRDRAAAGANRHPAGHGDGRAGKRSITEGDVAAMCSSWFDESRTAARPVDGYAEWLVVDVFKKAICQVVMDDQQPPATAVSGRRSKTEVVATLDDYALNLVQCILEESRIDLEKRMQKIGGGPAGVAGHGGSAREEWSVDLREPEDSTLVGHYGVGPYWNNPQIQALLYWLCASYMGLPSLVYFSHGNSQTEMLPRLAEAVRSRDWSVGALFSEVLLWCSTGVDQSQGSIVESLFDFLLMKRLR